MTYIGGRAVQCNRCHRIYGTHSTWHPSGWCNHCQATTGYTSWIFLCDGESEADYHRHACAERGPDTLGMPPDERRFMAPMCALDNGHDGDHEDNITRDRWSHATKKAPTP